MLDHRPNGAAPIGRVANGEGERAQDVDVLHAGETQSEIGAIEACGAEFKQADDGRTRHELVGVVEITLR